jgi:hypothetical protein
MPSVPVWSGDRYRLVTPSNGRPGSKGALPDGRRLGEEREQHLVGPVRELEARVGEDPVVVPVEVVDPVLPDVAARRLEPVVSGRQRLEVVDPCEEVDLVESSPPRAAFGADVVEDLATRGMNAG